MERGEEEVDEDEEVGFKIIGPVLVALDPLLRWPEVTAMCTAWLVSLGDDDGDTDAGDGGAVVVGVCDGVVGVLFVESWCLFVPTEPRGERSKDGEEAEAISLALDFALATSGVVVVDDDDDGVGDVGNCVCKLGADACRP